MAEEKIIKYHPVLRMILYGFIYWLAGMLITFAETRLYLSGSLITVLFYCIATALPLIFFAIYFNRTVAQATPSEAFKVSIVWIIAITIFDGILYGLFFRMPYSIYLSLNLLISHIILLAVGQIVAVIFRSRNSKTKLEGLEI